jgi:hypothetical protein
VAVICKTNRATRSAARAAIESGNDVRTKSEE